MRHALAGSHSAGFTLVEALLATLLMMVIVGALATVTAQWLPNWGRGFAHIETWVFDLDNTLYPHHVNLWQQVDERIRIYLARFLDITHEEAFRVQKDYYRRYGTTMRGMMSEHGMQPDEFLDFVHQIEPWHD